MIGRMRIHNYTIRLTEEGKAFNDITTLVQIEMTNIQMTVELQSKSAGYGRDGVSLLCS